MRDIIFFSPAFAAGYLIGLVFPIQDLPEIVSRNSYRETESLLPQDEQIHESEQEDAAK